MTYGHCSQEQPQVTNPKWCAPSFQGFRRSGLSRPLQPPKKGAKVVKEETNISLGPQVREGELVFGVARIFASFNVRSIIVARGAFADPSLCRVRWEFGQAHDQLLRIDCRQSSLISLRVWYGLAKG